MSAEVIYLKSQADRRLKKGHVWIYSNEVDTRRSPLKGLAPGAIVRVLSSSEKPLGLAFLNPSALICGRLLTRNPEANINKKFFAKHIKRALTLRELCFSGPFYRLFYGDSDGVPGLVIDRFGDYFVVQMSLAGLDAMKDEVAGALRDIFSPQAILFRNDHSGRDIEQLESHVEAVGDFPEVLEIEENGTRFQVETATAQKTGWFYDHRDNRAYLQSLASGKRVLDVFSYVGAWGLEAMAAGAASLTCVDASQNAIDHVLSNAEMNGWSEQVRGIRGKAIEALKQLIGDGERFDIVVLDPPAFIKKRKDQKAGESAYRHINELGIRLLEDDGILVSASCSMPLENATLTEIVRGAARHLDRNAQLFYTGVQAADHPVHPAIPETQYIKAQFYRIYR